MLRAQNRAGKGSQFYWEDDLLFPFSYYYLCQILMGAFANNFTTKNLATISLYWMQVEYRRRSWQSLSRKMCWDFLPVLFTRYFVYIFPLLESLWIPNSAVKENIPWILFLRQIIKYFSHKKTTLINYARAVHTAQFRYRVHQGCGSGTAFIFNMQIRIQEGKFWGKKLKKCKEISSNCKFMGKQLSILGLAPWFVTFEQSFVSFLTFIS